MDLVVESGAAVAGAAKAVSAVATAAEAVQGVAAVAKTAEVVGEVGVATTGVKEVAQVVPDLAASRGVAGLVVEVETSTDVLAGERAIARMTKMPDKMSLSSEGPMPVEPEVEIPEFTPSQEAMVKTRVETDLQKWEQQNPTPDQKAKPDEYKRWCEQREVAEINYITNTKVEITMRDWVGQNPEPDKIREPEKHKQWQSKRDGWEQKISEQIRKEVTKLKENERTNVLVEIKKLSEAYAIRMDIIEAIKALHEKENKTAEDKITLGKLQDRKLSLDAEIRFIEADLKVKAKLSTPVITLTISAALAGTALYKVGQEEGVF